MREIEDGGARQGARADPGVQSRTTNNVNGLRTIRPDLERTPVLGKVSRIPWFP